MSDETATQHRVLIDAGYPALRAGLIAMLGFEPDIIAGDESAMGNLTPDVIVIDAGTLTENAIDDLSGRFPAAPIIQIGAELDAADFEMLTIPGGYLPADVDSPALIAAVRAVVQGLTVIAPGIFSSDPDEPASSDVVDAHLLTPREREVLALVAEGLPNKAIARRLGISEHTAKFHVGSVLGKLGASSRAEAVMLATRRGLLAV